MRCCRVATDCATVHGFAYIHVLRVSSLLVERKWVCNAKKVIIITTNQNTGNIWLLAASTKTQNSSQFMGARMSGYCDFRDYYWLCFEIDARLQNSSDIR